MVKCFFENKCNIDVRTRRFCPACRIKKCFQMGMNSQMILDDREKKKRLNKVAENRVKKRLATESDCPTTLTASLLELKTEPLNEMEQKPTPFSNPCDLLDSSDPTSGNTFERPKTPVGKAHGDTPNEIFKHPTPDLIPTDPTMFYKLVPEEECNLSNITSAYRKTLGAMLESGPHTEAKEYQRAADLVNNSEIAVRKLIVFVKYLDNFKVMSQSDQISILKSCVMNTLLLRSALFYSIEKDAWVTSKHEIPSSILKSATGFVDIHNSHVYYCRRVKSMAENDITFYALLQVLIIFDPSVAQISNRQFISSIQDKYLILLKHYLESRFSYVFAKNYYISAIDRLCDLKALSEKHANVLLQVKPVEVEPLMLEVLNLK